MRGWAKWFFFRGGRGGFFFSRWARATPKLDAKQCHKKKNKFFIRNLTAVTSPSMRSSMPLKVAVPFYLCLSSRFFFSQIYVYIYLKENWLASLCPGNNLVLRPSASVPASIKDRRARLNRLLLCPRASFASGPERPLEKKVYSFNL